MLLLVLNVLALLSSLGFMMALGVGVYQDMRHQRNFDTAKRHLSHFQAGSHNFVSFSFHRSATGS